MNAEIFIDEKGNINGTFSGVKEIDGNVLKFPKDVKIFAYIVKGGKAFTTSITCDPEGDEIVIPPHKKKALNISLIYGR